jgi:hypothetical protein
MFIEVNVLNRWKHKLIMVKLLEGKECPGVLALITDVAKARNVEDIAYWMVDDDYDRSNFVVKYFFLRRQKR